MSTVANGSSRVVRARMLRLATIPHSGRYQQIGRSFESSFEIKGPAEPFGRTTGHMIGLYEDGPRTIPAQRAPTVRFA